jgi:predicted phosphodiesterase
VGVRIVILGDFHLKPEEYEITQSAMEDIRNSKPDLIIPLGDFGSHGKIGSIAGLEEAEPFLRYPGVPLRPILGNHDLEKESGDGEQPKGTIEKRFMSMFELDKPYGVIEYEQVRFFFASTEPQSPDSCYNVQEVFATDEQFRWLKSKLKERPGVPVIFFTHAPPVGSGLRTVPRVHVRSTNAYLDENHDPYRWYHLFKNTPEIIMWFSAHYHLSHIHPDSHTERFGTHFFITGVHGAAFTRDGMRQSRIVDIGPNSVEVLTLDHIKRAVTAEGGWKSDNLKSLVQKTEVALKRIQSFSVGEAPSIVGGIVPLSSGRVLVSTEDGFTWEVEPRVEAVFGTCHIGPALKAVAASDERIWMAWDRYVGYSDQHSPWRFVRAANGEWPTNKLQFDAEVGAMALHPDGGVWAAAGNNLLSIGCAAKSEALIAQRITSLKEAIRLLVSEGDSLWAIGESGSLYCFDGEQAFLPVMERVFAWDIWRGYSATLREVNGGLVILSKDEHSQFSQTLPVTLDVVDDASKAQVVSLGHHRVLVRVGVQVFLVIVNEQSIQKVKTDRAASIARSYHDSDEEVCSAFFISVGSDNESIRPKLELWEINVLHPRAGGWLVEG